MHRQEKTPHSTIVSILSKSMTGNSSSHSFGSSIIPFLRLSKSVTTVSARKSTSGGPEYGDYQADELRARTRGPMIDDFYDDWAFAQFGPESAQEISELFQELDGQLPVTTQWIDGPGSLYPDTRPWEEIAPEYDFVNTFAVFRSAVQGAGNLERFDYWLNNFTYMRSVAQLNCAWGQFDRAMKTLDTETDPQKKSELAEKTALPGVPGNG